MTIKYLLAAFGLLLLTACVDAQQPQGITLEQAKKMALEQNSQLLIQREKIVENQEKVKEAKSKRYPILLATGNYAYNGVSNDITLRKGSFGNYQASNILVPEKDITLLKSKHNLYSFGGLAVQPITDQGKINAGIKAANTDVEIAHTQALQSEQEVNQAVEKLYYGSLIALKREESIKVGIELIRVRLYDVESALSAGKTDSSVKTGLEAELADQEEKLLEAAHQREDDEGDLAVMMGLPYTSVFSLKEQPDLLPVVQPIEFYLQSEKANNLEILIAGQTLRKAGYGVLAAEKDFLPSLNAIGGYSNQSLISVLPTNNYFLGLMLSWNFIDFGKRRSVLNERKSQQKQAELNLDHSKRKMDNEVAKAYRKLIQSRELLASSQKALDYRRADYKLKKDHSDAGLILPKDLLETRAALVKAEQDYFSVQLGYRLAITALEVAAGILK
ncbi:MAG TPA: TolC family protein [Puia sp.]|nr:TolC family protein [Puia sp.]